MQRITAAEQRAMNANLSERLMQLTIGPVSSGGTPAHRGFLALSTLQNIERGIVIAKSAAGEAILTEDEQQALVCVGDLEVEIGVVKFMTPKLAMLRGCTPADTVGDACAPVLVNSEQLQWLMHKTTVARKNLHLKPDLYRSWLPFVSLRDGSTMQGKGTDYHFGVIDSYRLQCAQCVAEVYEAKKHSVLTGSDFGELCAYHECISGTCRGVLFGTHEFWLYETFQGNPVRLVKAQWAVGGSADVFRSFFSASNIDPPLVTLLRALLNRLNATVCQDKGCCYLGSGASGHVFRVCVRGHEDPCALKVVLASSPVDIVTEFERMKAAVAQNAPVVPPVNDSIFFHKIEDIMLGGGFLLSKVGAPAAVTSKTKCVKVFAALAALHDVGVFHGDARLPNLVVVDKTMLWIDLRGGGVSCVVPELKGTDAGILARSVLGIAMNTDAALPATVQAAVCAYNASPTTVTTIATAVWEASTFRGSENDD
jgi:hypothetical protein